MEDPITLNEEISHKYDSYNNAKSSTTHTLD